MKCGNKKRKHSVCKVTRDDLISIVLCRYRDEGTYPTFLLVHAYSVSIRLQNICVKYSSDILVTITTHNEKFMRVLISADRHPCLFQIHTT